MFLSQTKIFLFFKNFFDAPVNVYNNIYLNLIGLQIFRYLTHNFFFKISLSSKKIDRDFTNLYEKLKNEGIIKVENFLNEADFNFVEKVFDQRLKSKDGLINQKTGIFWKTLIFDKYTTDIELKKVHNLFIKNKLINELMTKSLNIKDIGNPIIGFQFIENPSNNIDNKDRETLIHSDRFYPCFKLFLTLNENLVKNGAYKYARYSHLLSFKRLLHEYDFSIRQSLQNKGFNLKKNIKLNRCLPRKFFLDEVCKDIEDITTEKNTLVISNNKGFHQRGTMESGTYRKHIRIVFYYLQRPFYYFFFKKIYDLFLKLKSK
jgi:hypothetical protein